MDGAGGPGEEEDREIKLNEQRTKKEGKEKMEDKPKEAETAEEEGIEDWERIDQTKPRQEEEETDTRTEQEEGIEEEEETDQTNLGGRKRKQTKQKGGQCK